MWRMYVKGTFHLRQILTNTSFAYDPVRHKTNACIRMRQVDYGNAI